MLPWIIAALPFTLLIVSVFAGVWPHPLTLVVHIVVIFAVITVDVRLLLRASAAMSFLPALRTPVYYLYQRGLRTGRERASVILAIVTTGIWVLALGISLLGMLERATRDPEIAIVQTATSVTRSAVELNDAVGAQLNDPSKERLDDVHEAAEDLVEATDRFTTLLDFASFPESEEQTAAELRDTATRVGTAAEELTQGRSPFELESLMCPVAVETRDFVTAMANHLEVDDQTGAETWRRSASQWESTVVEC